MPHALGAPVGRPQPFRGSSREPATTSAGLHVQRPELVHAYHPSIGGWMVVEVQDAVHLRGELGVATGFPGLRGLPRHAFSFEDLAQSFAADLSDSVDEQHFSQFRQAPHRERPAQVTRTTPGDAGDAFTRRPIDLPRPARTPFRVQRVEPPLVELVDHLPYIRLADLHQPCDRGHRLPLRRSHHHDGSSHPDRLPARLGDLLQPAPLLRGHRPHKHFRSPSHRHHLHWQHHRPHAHDQPDTRLPKQPTWTRH